MDRESRSFPFEAELREDTSGLNFSGLSAVYDTLTDLGPFREQIARTFFTKTLKDKADVKLLVNHDGVPLARTKSGTLELRSEEKGLRASTPEGKPLDAANPTVQELASAMRRGDIDQMSFAFQAIQDEWDDEPEDGGTPIRTLKEGKLFDVSVVTYPAYEDTSAEVRSAVAAVATEHGISERAEVDNTAWDGPAAMSGCAAADDPAAAYGAICAGRRDGDPDLQSSWALPHHKAPGDPPNAAGVRSALSYLPQTQGLTNHDDAESHLNDHMDVINPDRAAEEPTHSEEEPRHSAALARIRNANRRRRHEAGLAKAS